MKFCEIFGCFSITNLLCTDLCTGLHPYKLIFLIESTEFLLLCFRFVSLLLLQRYLLRRLLQQQAATETVKLPLTTVAPVTSTPRPAAQSIAQLLGEVDKRRKKASTKKKPGVEEPAEKGAHLNASIISLYLATLAY